MEKFNNRFLANLANNITILRILLVPAFIGCLSYYSPEKDFLRVTAIFIFSFACLTDAFDGYFARKLGQETVFGSYIDPIADKLLLTSGFLCLSFMANLPASMKIPAWLTITVISRDVIIMIGSTLMFLTAGNLKAQPLLVGKVTTVFQMATLCSLLLIAPSGMIGALFLSTAVLTVLSGLLYIRIGQRFFQNQRSAS